MNEYERALELKEETIANRRFFHENAEKWFCICQRQKHL